MQIYKNKNQKKFFIATTSFLCIMMPAFLSAANHYNENRFECAQYRFKVKSKIHKEKADFDFSSLFISVAQAYLKRRGLTDTKKLISPLSYTTKISSDDVNDGSYVPSGNTWISGVHGITPQGNALVVMQPSNEKSTCLFDISKENLYAKLQAKNKIQGAIGYNSGREQPIVVAGVNHFTMLSNNSLKPIAMQENNLEGRNIVIRAVKTDENQSGPSVTCAGGFLDGNMIPVVQFRDLNQQGKEIQTHTFSDERTINNITKDPGRSIWGIASLESIMCYDSRVKEGAISEYILPSDFGRSVLFDASGNYFYTLCGDKFVKFDMRSNQQVDLFTGSCSGKQIVMDDEKKHIFVYQCDKANRDIQVINTDNDSHAVTIAVHADNNAWIVPQRAMSVHDNTLLCGSNYISQDSDQSEILIYDINKIPHDITDTMIIDAACQLGARIEQSRSKS